MMQEFVSEVSKTVKQTMKEAHTAMPGTIVSYDPATGLATVLPTMKFKKPDGESMDFPQVTGVPVVFPQSMNQQATIAYPVKPGDGCLIIVAEQSIDYFMYGQETDTDLDFDLTNSICIPGLFAKPNSVMNEAYSGNCIIIDLGGTRITVKSGEVVIDADKVTINGEVTVNGSVTAISDVLANSSISLARHTHTGDSGGSTSAPNG